MTQRPHETRSARELDVVVMGATGFVGRLVAAYLAEHAPSTVRVGLAGRSEARLAELRDELGSRAASWPLLLAQSQDPVALRRLAERTRVVATTVGPYLRHGMPLVEACVDRGTHYADLTGEVLFARASADRFHESASARGVRIVHSCGFDSVPSDLAVLMAAEKSHSDGSGELLDATLVAQMRAGFSGGTIDSLRNQLDAAAKDRSLRRTLVDPYALSPDRDAEPDLGDERDPTGVRRVAELGGWVGPFVMASYNTRVVRRSNALSGHRYGRALRYREVAGFGDSLTSPVLAAATAAGLGALVAGMGFGPTRAVLDRVLPEPGEGPDAEARAKGRFRMRVHARTSEGARYLATVAAQGDPGYAATSVMLGQSALCLAQDEHLLPDAAGVLTPATAMGAILAGRLLDEGFEVSVVRQ